MRPCCPHSRSAGRLFSRFARRSRRRFEKKGLEASQRQLVEGLERAGFGNASLLEVGSGVGYLHQYLLQRGAATAVGVDLAPKMIEEAEALARKNGLAERTHYRVYAYTIPRDRWYTRLGVALGALALWLVRSDYRSYVHRPELIEALVTAGGFTKRYENRTLVWLTQVYARS